MNILHICSYYVGNKLYKKLFSELSQQNDIYQEVYIPIRHKSLINKNIIDSKTIKFNYDNILLRKDRILYKNKIKKQLKRIESLIYDLNSVDIIHAHTLFSDGGTAYLLKKKFSLKYLVNIRGTDINFFYRYGLHLRGFMKKILENAEFIVFISQAYKDKVLELLPVSFTKKVEHKMHVIPNGIDEIWFDRKKDEKIHKVNDKINLTFTGVLNRNKNLQTVLNVLNALNHGEKRYFLHIVGDGPLEVKFKKYAMEKGITQDLKFYGYVNEKELVRIMDKSDIFILPSFQETFGISYIEAISRGVPVIYSKNQGIDGMFEEGQVGYSVNPTDSEDIIRKMKLINNQYLSISDECIRQSKSFTWPNVSKLYRKLYEDFLENNR